MKRTVFAFSIAILVSYLGCIVVPNEFEAHIYIDIRHIQQQADQALEPQLRSLLSSGLKLHEAIYKLRNGFIGYRGDVVFAYERKDALERTKAA